MDIKFIPFQSHSDKHGSLVAVENYENIRFTVKRVSEKFKKLFVYL